MSSPTDPKSPIVRVSATENPNTLPTSREEEAEPWTFSRPREYYESNHGSHDMEIEEFDDWLSRCSSMRSVATESDSLEESMGMLREMREILAKETRGVGEIKLSQEVRNWLAEVEKVIRLAERNSSRGGQGNLFRRIALGRGNIFGANPRKLQQSILKLQSQGNNLLGSILAQQSPSLDLPSVSEQQSSSFELESRGNDLVQEGEGVDGIISRLLDARDGKPALLKEGEIRQLCRLSRDIFLEQPNLLELETPVKICGNIHGQYLGLLRLFKFVGFPPQANYLFLGDYVDYGKQNIETICLLLAYKIKYKENFFLLRGNHECAGINRVNGFYDECKRKFNVRLWKLFNDCFNCLPVAAVIEEKILCVHGGLSPYLKSLDQIRSLPRPTDVPDSGLLRDLLWSDPTAVGLHGWRLKDEGNSYTFGADTVEEFVEKHDLDLICRAHHQPVEDGYEFFAERRLVSIFSALNFHTEFDNAGAVMSVDETLMCSFHKFNYRN